MPDPIKIGAEFLRALASRTREQMLLASTHRKRPVRPGLSAPSPEDEVVLVERQKGEEAYWGSCRAWT
jgi:hypothetical protein